MLALRVLLAVACCGAAASKPPLRLRPSNTFQIAAFSDLHYGENEDSFGIPQDINSTLLMNHVLDTENPDFVVLNGDLITGENTYGFNSTKYIDVIVKPLVNRGYSWASTYGNHDSKYNLSRQGVLREEQKYSGSYTQHGPPGTDGVTNYVLPLYASVGAAASSAQLPIPGESPVALLYFLDSRGGSECDPSSNDNIPNFVSPGTTAWFAASTTAAKQQWGVLPSIMFVHIPVNAFLNVQQSKVVTVGGSHFPGLNADVPLAQQANSAVSNNVYTGEDVPFMQALLATEGLHSIYSGHDHGDSWCGLWPDNTTPSGPSLNAGSTFASNGRPFLCFCKHSGFGGYGTWNRGVRQILLSFDEAGDMRVETWDRMQDGSDHAQVVTKVVLNNTYGQDVYPMADGGYHTY